MKVKEKTLLCI